MVSGTLVQNGTFGTIGATRAKIQAAAVGVDDFSPQRSDRFDTLIVGISSGKKQRVMILRFLVNKPTCVVLEDANASLDLKTEAVVN